VLELPGLVSVTTKDVGVPPDAESVIVKVSVRSAEVTATVGVLGGDGRGVTELDAEDAALVPYVFVAVAVNVYPVPGVNPLMLQDPVRGVPVGELMVQDPPPPDAVTVNESGRPPVAVAPMTVTVAVVPLRETVGCWGAPGASPDAPTTNLVYFPAVS